MMDGWGGHTHLRDRNCVCSITRGGGGVFGLNWPPGSYYFPYFFFWIRQLTYIFNLPD